MPPLTLVLSSIEGRSILQSNRGDKAQGNLVTMMAGLRFEDKLCLE